MGDWGNIDRSDPDFIDDMIEANMFKTSYEWIDSHSADGITTFIIQGRTGKVHTVLVDDEGLLTDQFEEAVGKISRKKK